MYLKRIFFLVLALFCTPLLAQEGDPFNLEATYGKQLTAAPYALKYKFTRETGKDWKYSSYDSRKEFLTAWHARLKKEDDAKKEKENARLKALKDAQEKKREQKLALENKIKDRHMKAKERKNAERVAKTNSINKYKQQRIEIDRLRNSQNSRK